MDRVAEIPIQKNGEFDHFLKLSWGLIDNVLSRCDLLTVCMVRDVCKGLQEAVDFLFAEYSQSRNVNMVAVASQVGKMVDKMGLNVADSLMRCQTSCSCRRCAMRMRMLVKKFSIKKQ